MNFLKLKSLARREIIWQSATTCRSIINMHSNLMNYMNKLLNEPVKSLGTCLGTCLGTGVWELATAGISADADADTLKR